MLEKPFRILYRDNQNDIRPYFEFDTTQYETAEAALDDAKKEYPDQECVIVKIFYQQQGIHTSGDPSKWVDGVPT
jgi:hypothetical protein